MLKPSPVLPRSCALGGLLFGGLSVLLLMPAGCRETPPAVPSPATAAADHKGPSAADLRRVRVLIAGDVQGVGFRAYTHAHAQGLGLTGYVTNLSNGQVEAVAEGPAGHIDQWLDRLRQGPEGSRVDQVTVTEEPPESQFTGFWMSD